MFYDADLYTNDMETRLMRRTKCDHCGEHIQDEKCIELPDGEIWCSECEHEDARELWFKFSHDDYETNVEEE